MIDRKTVRSLEDEYTSERSSVVQRDMLAAGQKVDLRLQIRLRYSISTHRLNRKSYRPIHCRVDC